jgi:hypothetical protein
MRATSSWLISFRSREGSLLSDIGCALGGRSALVSILVSSLTAICLKTFCWLTTRCFLSTELTCFSSLSAGYSSGEQFLFTLIVQILMRPSFGWCMYFNCDCYSVSCCDSGLCVCFFLTTSWLISRPAMESVLVLRALSISP